MSRCLRYRNPTICEYLAGQYVVGVMTPRVRSRMEALLKTTPELDRAVAFWADHCGQLQAQMPEVHPQADLWQQLDQAIADEPSTAQTKQSNPWWQKLLLWQVTGVVSMATTLALGFLLLFTPATPGGLGGPNYLAAMSSVSDEQQIQFVISAYQKTEQQPSRLHVQWSKHKTVESAPVLHLWAEDRDTGKLTYIGVQPEQTDWSLTKPQWQAITSSGRLLMTADEQQPDTANTLFTGPCIQLKPWKTQTI